MRKSIHFIFFFLLNVLCSNAQVSESLGNKEIIQLSSAGIDNNTIINKIQSSGSLKKFDVTTSGIIELKQGGVSENVINFLINYTKAVEKNEKASFGTLNASLKNIYESGIYFQTDNSDFFKKLDASVVTGGRDKNGFFVINDFSTLAGKTSSATIKNQQPSFYFCFDSTTLSLNSNANFRSGIEDFATNPNDFKLVKLVSKKGYRGFLTQRGNESGIHGKSVIPFTYIRLSKSQFQVDFYNPLEEGEYCFYYSNNSLLNNATNFDKIRNQKDVKVYDFSIVTSVVNKNDDFVKIHTSKKEGQQEKTNILQDAGSGDVIDLPLDVGDVIEYKVLAGFGSTIFKIYYLEDGSQKVISQLTNRNKWSYSYKASKKNQELYLEALPGLNSKVGCKIYINNVLMYDSKNRDKPKVFVNKN